MKHGRKKAGHDEPEEQISGGRGAGGDTSDTPGGIDAIRLLQLITGGVALITLAWLVLHMILNII